MAGHLLYTQVLDDAVPEERRLGIRAHLAYLDAAEAVVVYEDFGTTPGMEESIRAAREMDLRVCRRTIGREGAAPGPGGMAECADCGSDAIRIKG